VTADRVRQAGAALAGVAVRTPLLSASGLDAAVGAGVVCKAENLQRTNSFKFRGAYHHLVTLPGPVRDRGVVAASSGNHAQALALAARLLNTRATVVVPADIPATKADAIARLGATVVTYRRGVDDRDAIVADLAHSRGLAVVPSADSPAVMSGAGTVGLEFLTDVPDLSVLLVPVGGGGLAAGCATIAKAMSPRTRVIGVEPVAGNDTHLSLQAGRRVTVPAPETIADGLRHTTPAAGPFAINQRLLDDVLTVTDDQIAEAMALALTHLKVVVEPSGATGLAALIGGAVPSGWGRIGVVISGGNVDWAVLRSLTDRSIHSGLSRLRAGDRSEPAS
jgi:threonine dehydratase